MSDDYNNRRNNLHIAFIPDGNRRYALERGLKSYEGYWEGEKTFERILEHIYRNYPEIKTVSIYALSNENFLKRPVRELKELFKLFTFAFKKILGAKEKKVRVRIIGKREGLDSNFIKLIDEVMNFTKYYTEKTLNILLNFQKDDSIGKDVDLLIRTGKPVQYRTSGFSPLDIRYAELKFVDGKTWCEFTPEDFDECMRWYYKQQRNFGE